MTKKLPAIGTFLLKLHTEAPLIRKLKRPGNSNLIGNPNGNSIETGRIVFVNRFSGEQKKWND